MGVSIIPKVGLLTKLNDEVSMSMTISPCKRPLKAGVRDRSDENVKEKAIVEAVSPSIGAERERASGGYTAL